MTALVLQILVMCYDSGQRDNRHRVPFGDASIKSFSIERFSFFKIEFSTPSFYYLRELWIAIQVTS